MEVYSHMFFCNGTKSFIREMKMVFKLESFIAETVNSASTYISISIS